MEMSPCPTEEQSSSHTLQGVQCHQDAPSPLLEAGWVQPELCCLLAQASGIVPQAGSCPSKPGAWLQTQQWLPEERSEIPYKLIIPKKFRGAPGAWHMNAGSQACTFQAAIWKILFCG
ncbi:uncharacterized protein LOC144332902 [Macaca mulatta]